MNKNILSIYEAAESDWPSPTSFNFLILNPMMLDFERLIFHNTQNQKIALIQDGEDALFIEGCGGGEKIRIVMNKSFPCIDNSMYYKKSYNASIFRKIFYRFYQSIGNVISDFEYPSIVVIIDTIENKDLFKGSSKN